MVKLESIFYYYYTYNIWLYVSLLTIFWKTFFFSNFRFTRKLRGSLLTIYCFINLYSCDINCDVWVILIMSFVPQIISRDLSWNASYFGYNSLLIMARLPGKVLSFTESARSPQHTGADQALVTQIVLHQQLSHLWQTHLAKCPLHSACDWFGYSKSAVTTVPCRLHLAFWLR